MICTAARKSASCSMKSTATPKSVITRLSAACTGLRAVTTPSAPTRMTAAAAANTRMSGQVGRVEASSRAAWTLSTVSVPSHGAAGPARGLLALPRRLGLGRRLVGLRFGLGRLGLGLRLLAGGPQLLHPVPGHLQLLPVARRPFPGPPNPAPHAAVGQRDVLVEQMGLEHLTQRLRPGGLVVAPPRLPALGGAYAVAELARPLHLALVGGAPRRRRGAHPARRHEVVALAPVFPGELLGRAVVVHHQLVLGVDGVG